MTRYARVSKSKYDRLQDVLKLMIKLRENPTLKQVIRVAKLADNLLQSIRDGSLLEEPTERLLPGEGIYFVIMRDRITHMEFADDRPRLPLFRTMRDAVVSMERNGWTEEARYVIVRIDLMRIKNARFSGGMIAKYKQKANEDTDNISGDH